MADNVNNCDICPNILLNVTILVIGDLIDIFSQTYEFLISLEIGIFTFIVIATFTNL